MLGVQCVAVLVYQVRRGGGSINRELKLVNAGGS